MGMHGFDAHKPGLQAEIYRWGGRAVEGRRVVRSVSVRVAAACESRVDPLGVGGIVRSRRDPLQGDHLALPLCSARLEHRECGLVGVLPAARPHRERVRA